MSLTLKLPSVIYGGTVMVDHVRITEEPHIVTETEVLCGESTLALAV